jgi:hypothetical protein
MHVMTYASVVRAIQPIIVPVFDALTNGLREASEEHARRSLRREDDPWYYLHSTRRSALEYLRTAGGLAATVEEGDRSMLPLSGLLIPYRNVVLRLLRPDTNRAGLPEIPIPGRSQAKQSFYRQKAISGLEGADHVLLIWTDTDGVLDDPVKLARPSYGDHRRDTLRLSWDGPLRRSMASLRAEDLDVLRPDHDYGQIEDGASE